MDKIVQFFKESWYEVTQEVHWPTVAELQSSATLVLVASLLFALVVGGIDFMIDNALRLLFQSI